MALQHLRVARAYSVEVDGIDFSCPRAWHTQNVLRTLNLVLSIPRHLLCLSALGLQCNVVFFPLDSLRSDLHADAEIPAHRTCLTGRKNFRSSGCQIYTACRPVELCTALFGRRLVHPRAIGSSERDNEVSSKIHRRRAVTKICRWSTLLGVYYGRGED